MPAVERQCWLYGERWMWGQEVLPFLLEGALELLREVFLEKKPLISSTVFFHCQASSKKEKKKSKQAVFLDEGKAEQNVLIDMCGIKYQRHRGISKYK